MCRARALFVLLVLQLFGQACGGRAAQPVQAAPAPQSYRVMKVEPRAATLYIDVPATVTGEQNVEIRPMIDGYIEAIFVDEGAWVHARQPLFQIKAPQYEQEVRTAEAGIETAAAEVSSARMSVDKVKPLVDKRIISEYELQSAQYALQSKVAALAQARATLANAKTNLSYTKISSPSDGVIGSLPFKIGSLVTTSMAEPLTTVSNIANVYAYFSVNEKIMLSLTRDIAGNTLQEKLAGMPEVTFLMADGTPHEYKGHVQAASGLIDTETGSTRFRATFPNPRGLLRSGASGQVRLPRPIEHALLVPQSASYELQGKHFVFVVSTENKVRATEVAVQALPQGQFYVVQKGLNAGDTVVLDGLTTLKDGTVIKPVSAQVDFAANTH
jgi:membrane fusion protein (multidrug efflux system)